MRCDFMTLAIRRYTLANSTCSISVASSAYRDEHRQVAGVAWQALAFRLALSLKRNLRIKG